MRPEAVKGPGHDQFFQHPTVEFFNICTRAEIEQFAEIAALITGFNDRLNRTFADAFNRADTINDFAIVVNVEMVQAGVNIRRQNFQPHPPALIHEADDFFGVIHIRGHHRRHKFSRIVRLQPQRLIGH